MRIALLKKQKLVRFADSANPADVADALGGGEADEAMRVESLEELDAILGGKKGPDSHERLVQGAKWLKETIEKGADRLAAKTKALKGPAAVRAKKSLARVREFGGKVAQEMRAAVHEASGKVHNATRPKGACKPTDQAAAPKA